MLKKIIQVVDMEASTKKLNKIPTNQPGRCWNQATPNFQILKWSLVLLKGMFCQKFLGDCTRCFLNHTDLTAKTKKNILRKLCILKLLKSQKISSGFKVCCHGDIIIIQLIFVKKTFKHLFAFLQQDLHRIKYI